MKGTRAKKRTKGQLESKERNFRRRLQASLLDKPLLTVKI